MFPQEIFSTERWNDGPVEYTVNGLGPGTYEVALLFMEGCCNDGGCNDDPAMDVECRRFDVVVNGTTVEAAFSQVLRASEITGNTPDAASYRVAVSLVAEASLAAGEPLEIQIVDLGAGNPPENAAIKAVAVVPAGGPPLRVFHRGDTTGEGNINITDGVGVFNWLFLGGTTPGCIEAANANDGATVNITSGVYLLNFLFLGGPAPPPPGPPGPGSVCGPDPVGSPSNLGCQTYNGC
jgi:hypothetical protein